MDTKVINESQIYLNNFVIFKNNIFKFQNIKKLKLKQSVEK